MNQRTSIAVRQDEQIQNNVANIERAKKASALEMMASRLNVSPIGLKNTLLNTVFKKATDDEFVALMIVANAYGLNPLTKEIYAFPAKGGGIVPVVSIDGWIRIANEHPAMDGFEFVEIPDDKGKLMAVETTIWRKDRTRPIKMRAYLDECIQSTDPWKKLPARMLNHKSFIQCARYAFGFSGIASEGDEEFIGDVRLGGDTIAPMRTAQRALTVDNDGNSYDEQTGELIADEDLTEDERGQGEARDDQGFTKDSCEELADDLIARFKRAEMVADYNSANSDFTAHYAEFPDEIVAAVQSACDAANARLNKR